MRRIGFAFAVCTLFSLHIPEAVGNEGTIEYDTSVAGQIVPTTETLIRVREENLVLRFRQVKAEDDPITEGYFPYMDTLRVAVSASYTLENPSDRKVALHLAFPILRNGVEEEVMKQYAIPGVSMPPDHRRGLRCSVTLGRYRLPFEYRSFESLFEKERAKWVAGVKAGLHKLPEIARGVEEMERLRIEQETRPTPVYPTSSTSEILLSGRMTVAVDKSTTTFRLANATPAEAMREQFEAVSRLENWNLWRKHFEFKGGIPPHRAQPLIGREVSKDPRVDRWPLATLAYLYGTLNPEGRDDVTEFLDRWGVEQSYLDPKTGDLRAMAPADLANSSIWDESRLARRIDFLEYRPVLPAGSSTELRVDYSHILDIAAWQTTDSGWEAYPQFQYILRTSKRWTHFGPIHVRVYVPNNFRFRATPGLVLKKVRTDSKETLYTCELDGATVRDNLMFVFLDTFDKKPEPMETPKSD